MHFLLSPDMDFRVSYFTGFCSQKKFIKNIKMQHQTAFFKVFMIKAGKCKAMYLC